MSIIPLNDLVLAADVGEEHGGKPVRVKAFHRSDTEANSFDMQLCACDVLWKQHPEHQMGLLYERIWTLVQGLGIPVELVHSALQPVPEYIMANGKG